MNLILYALGGRIACAASHSKSMSLNLPFDQRHSTSSCASNECSPQLPAAAAQPHAPREQPLGAASLARPPPLRFQQTPHSKPPRPATTRDARNGHDAKRRRGSREKGMATDPRPSFFDAITAAATRPGGFEDAKAMRDELRRKSDKAAPNAPKRRGFCTPGLGYNQQDRVTDEHLRTMASMMYSLSFAPKTVHTQIWCAWWWWPEEIAKLLEDVRFYGWGVSSLQSAGSPGSGNSGRGYLRRLKWVGIKGEWHEGADLTPEGREFFAEFLEMDLDDVPEGLKQVPFLPELMAATFVGLCAYLPISYVVCCCHKRYVLTRIHVILSS